MNETERARPGGAALELVALRRHQDSTAERLRRDVPLTLARLAAEVCGSLIHLRVTTSGDGVVSAEVGIDAGEDTGELLREAAAVLAPVAEVTVTDPKVAGSDWTVWPLISTPRAQLGFGAGGGGTAAGIRWTEEAGTLDLPAIVGVHPNCGLWLRLRAEKAVSDTQQWIVDAAALTTGQRPSFRLRARIRSAFPGLYVADEPGDAAVLRVDADQVHRCFAVPVGGEGPVIGMSTGGAAPLPATPTRGSLASEQAVRIGAAVTAAGGTIAVEMDVQERLRHIHVVGRTGTGKSSLLAGIANEIARSEDGMLVLDPHGHLVQRIIAELPASAANRVWVVRCGDVNNPVPLNPLAIDDPIGREIAIDDVCGVFQYLFDKKSTGIVGPRFRERVAMGLRALTAVFGGRASVLDVPAALASADFVAKAARVAEDDRLRAWLANDISHRRSGEYGDLVSWVNSKFEALSSTTAMRGILGSGADAIDMTVAMDAGRIILIDLSKSTLGESATSLLGYLYLNRVWTSALQRTRCDRSFTVVVDEAQAIISGSLTAMLSEGRKFGVAVVLAHQYLGQLDEDLRPAVDGNVATTIAFRGAVSDLPTLRERFGESVEATTLMTLPDLSAIVMRTAAGAVAEPYTLIVDHNHRVTARSGVTREEFEAAILRSTAHDLVEPYRELTEPAAAGKSRAVQQMSNKSDTTESSPQRRAADRPVPRSSFLDEWLAKRAQADHAPVDVLGPDSPSERPEEPQSA